MTGRGSATGESKPYKVRFDVLLVTFVALEDAIEVKEISIFRAK
jgi:hypothetical protein